MHVPVSQPKEKPAAGTAPETLFPGSTIKQHQQEKYLLHSRRGQLTAEIQRAADGKIP